MKLYQVDTPLPCDIEECGNTNAVLIVRTDEGTDHAVCPECVQNMSDMNGENAEFFAQVPLPGQVSIDMANIEDPAVQARLLAVHERQLQAEQQTAAFYDLMADSQ